MTADYRKLNQVVTAIAAAVPDVVSFLEQINTFPDVWYAVINWEMLSSQYLFIKTTRSSLNFGYQGQPHNFTVLPQGYIIFPALCQHLVHGPLDRHSLPQGTAVAYCIDAAVLIGPREQEIAIILDLLLRHLHVRVGNESDKNSGAFYLSRISRDLVV